MIQSNSQPSKPCTPPQVVRQSGIALVEVLVAVLILGIGILGVASTQVVALQMNSQSQNRSQAVLMAEDLLDRVRANPENAIDYKLEPGDAVGADGGACDTSYDPTEPTVAENDIASWENSLACLFPDAERTVVVGGAVVTVTISWDQNDANANPVIVRTQI